MRQRIRFWLKLAAALGLPVLIVGAVSPTTMMDEVRLGVEASMVEMFGSAEQLDRLTDRVARKQAMQDGEVEFYEAGKAFGDAVKAQRRLAERNWELADLALEVAQREREERQVVAATR